MNGIFEGPREEHRRRCFAALLELTDCWRLSTGDEKLMILDYLQAMRARYPISPPSPPVTELKMGMQGGFPYWDPLRIFSNLMHSSGEWFCKGSLYKLAALDGDGNPLEAAWCDIKPRGITLPPGGYAITWDTADGSVGVTGPGVESGQGGIYTFNSGPVRVEVGGAVTNLRLTHVNGGTYFEDTMALLRGKVHTFRFMDWAMVNNAGLTTEGERNALFDKLESHGVVLPDRTEETYWQYERKRWVPQWATRPRPTHTRFGGRYGVPWEVICQFCKDLQVRCAWVDQPLSGNQQGDIDYALGLGALMAIEWGGETIYELHNELWLSGPGKRIATERGEGDAARGAGLILRECWEAFCTGWTGAGGDLSLLKLSVMGSTGDVNFARNVVQSSGLSPDFVGCAYYLSSGRAVNEWMAQGRTDPTFSFLTPMKVLEDIERTAWGRMEQFLRAHATLAENIGAQLACYEGNAIAITIGGLSGTPAQPIVAAAHFEPYAGVLTRRMYEFLEEIGCERAVAFNFMHSISSAEYGMFGHWWGEETITPAGTEWLYFAEAQSWRTETSSG